MRLGKIVFLVLVLAFFWGIAFDEAPAFDSIKNPFEGIADNVIAGIIDNSEHDFETDIPADDVISIDEQVLFAQDGITVIAKEYITDSIWGDGIKVFIQNDTDKNLTISCDNLIVNNYMIYDLFSATIAAGKKSNETIYLFSSELEAAGIENVGQIELYFHVYDSDTYDRLFEDIYAVIQTSAVDSMDTVPADAGKELFNQDGIRITAKFVDEDSFWGTAVLLYLENTTDRKITVSCENMSINGFMVTPYFYSNICSGKRAIDTITILSSDLEQNGIESIEDIELSFLIYDSDTYETIVDSGPISFAVD